MTEDENKTGLDYTQLAEGLDELREGIVAMVAAMEAEGFTPREARAIIAGIWASRIDDNGTLCQSCLRPGCPGGCM